MQWFVYLKIPVGDCETTPSSSVSEFAGLRRRHRSAMSPAALTAGELPWHGIENRPSEDVHAKLRSRHKSSIDDRRFTIDMDDSTRDVHGDNNKIFKITKNKRTVLQKRTPR